MLGQADGDNGLTEKEIDAATRLLSIPSGLIEGCVTLSGDPVVFDEWQRGLIDTNDRFSIWNKARQAGFSFAVAGRAWARCYLSPPGTYTAIFTSYNLADAKEKIRYVKLIDEGFPEPYRMGRKVWAKTEVEFSNGNRIVTMFHPRGKGEADVVLDELAFIQEGKEVYRAALPVVSRGGAVLIGSSPGAKAGMFFDIMAGAGGKFKRFKRYNVEWFKSAALCTDPVSACAMVNELDMPELVERYGTPNLQDIFDNLFLEDFLSEYCCQWADESTAFITYDLIDSATPTGEREIKHCRNIEELSLLTGDLYGGFDVGLRRDSSVISIGENPPGSDRIEDKYYIKMDKKSFDYQENILYRIMEIPRVRKMLIDQNGIGEQLAFRASKRYGSRVQGQIISPTTKPQIAANVRLMLEQGNFLMFPDKEKRQQFHSVKRLITKANNIVYDVDRNEKHHGDIFFSYALMLWAFNRKRKRKPTIIVMG